MANGLTVANEPSTADEWYNDALTHDYYASTENKKSEAYNAIESYKKVLELDPKNTSVMYRLAAVYDIDLEDDSNALAYIEKGLKIEPENLDFLDKKGLYLSRLGNKQEAEVIYDQMIQIAERDWSESKNCGYLTRLSGIWDSKAKLHDDNLEMWKQYIEKSQKYGKDWRKCEGLD
ncbi:MAG: Tetratricopeptide repeat protein [Methanosaeta sp. PtaU1.Bin060]|nr:MAG: Tetratricopeptide repeat protein [Methanosaeta sp. PtaU1.Bin060]